MRFLTSEQIKAHEAKIITDLSSSLELINNAANACVKELMPFGAICIFCGKGNNGADGYRLAALLKERGKTVFAVMVYEPKTAECIAIAKQCQEMGIEIHNFSASLNLPYFDAAVDAVFGIGIKGNVDGSGLNAIRYINKLNKFTVSIDLPSGLNSDSGLPSPDAVRADKTVTFTAPKQGMIYGESADFCGEIITAKVGIPVDFNSVPPIFPINSENIAPLLPRRTNFSHKGTFGRLLMFTGSQGMLGAAAIAAKAAMRSGCGLVTIVCKEGLENTLNILVPEAVVLPVEKYELSGKIEAAVSSAGGILVGCGIGKSIPPAFITELIQKAPCPVVLDADGLNALSPFPEAPLGKNLILTPHPLEFSRMTQIPVSEIEKNRLSLATDFAANRKVTLVLKGARTVVAEQSGEAHVSLISTSALAKGGSGDVLSGIISSLCAQGISPENSAKLGVYLHSLSGRITARQSGEYSATIGELTDNLKLAFKEITDFQKGADRH